MRLTAVAAIMGIVTLAAPAFAGPKEGGEIYEMRCKMCHGTGIANAPLIAFHAPFDRMLILRAFDTVLGHRPGNPWLDRFDD